MSIPLNKNLTPLLNSLLNCISARSGTLILSIKDECTFLFINISNNSSANSLLKIFSFLTVPPEGFLSKSL